MDLFFKLVIFAVATCGTFGNDVRRLDIYTADCQDCGMSALGSLSVKLCGNGAGQCCVGENLDNMLGNDFNEGTISTFTGSSLGECNGFDMGEGVNWNNAVTLLHSGFDGGQFDYAIIFTANEVIRCYFHKFLDGNDFELGSGCVPEKFYLPNPSKAPKFSLQRDHN